MAAMFEPFPIWLREWEQPSLAQIPLVAVSKSKIVHASTTARSHGIKPNSSLASALAKVPELEIVEASSPYLTASWEKLVEDLAGFTRTLEAPLIGRVFMQLELPDAVQLAESYRIRVGMAESLEVATLAAFIASPGRVKVILPEKQRAILDALPLYFLRGVGLSQRLLTDLGWLGVSTAGELQRWKKPQVTAFLGRSGKHVMPYLFGPHRTYLSRYTPAARISLGMTFDEPQFEPAVLEPVLERLSQELSLELVSKAATRLSVYALSQGLEHKASRLSKTFLRRPGEIYRLALLTLEDTGAQALGIEGLTLELGGLSRPSIQGSLWPKKERLEHAVAAVENRFPKAILELVDDDAYALAADRAVRLVVRSTGEEVSRETQDDLYQRPHERVRSPLRA
jgi:nucleotidyltransferase/DNA polymerase involved in DNA repair